MAATLMPGLIEAHSHLSFTDVAQSVELGFIPPEEHTLKTAANARRMLDAGFTSCFSAAAAKARLDVVLRNAVDNGIENMKALHRRGVRVLIGGDYGFAWNPVGTDARDVGHFVDLLGFSPMDAILAATRLGGQIMGMGDRLGQVRPGYLADLLLVDGDPLRDVAILQQGSRLKAIMKDGVFWKPPATGIVRTQG